MALYISPYLSLTPLAVPQGLRIFQDLKCTYIVFAEMGEKSLQNFLRKICVLMQLIARNIGEVR